MANLELKGLLIRLAEEWADREFQVTGTTGQILDEAELSQTRNFDHCFIQLNVPDHGLRVAAVEIKASLDIIVEEFPEEDFQRRTRSGERYIVNLERPT